MGFSKKIIVVLVLIIALAAGGGLILFQKSKASPYELATIKRGDLIQEISLTGRVKPAEAVDLAFEKSGRVASISVNVGDRVFVGRVLAVLENTDLKAQLAQAEAAVESSQAGLLQAQAALEGQEAKLQELKNGTRSEEMKIYEGNVESAKAGLEEAKKNSVDKLADAYTKADDGVRNRVDRFFSSPRSNNPQLVFTLSDSQLKTDLEWQRVLVENSLVPWKTALDKLTTNSDLNAASSQAKQVLNEVKILLEKSAFALNSLTASSSLSQTTIDSWKADVALSRVNLNTAIANLSAAEEKLKTGESALKAAEDELAFKKAGTSSEQIAIQEAQLRQSQASIAFQEAGLKQSRANAENLQAQIEKTILVSPLEGVVAQKDIKRGEIVSPGKTIFSIISVANFEIEANIPEADVAKVKINNRARITLDAYGNDLVFEAKVLKIDPAETMIEGVATYKTKLQFIKEDEKIKSGMTANIDILTAKLENVLLVPQKAIIGKNGEKFVKILDDKGEVREVKVKTGLKDNSGNIEIIEGIREGERIVVSIKK